MAGNYVDLRHIKIILRKEKRSTHMTKVRVNEIDLLRFVAVLSVVFFHYFFFGHVVGDVPIEPNPLLGQVAKYGYLGVELFFIISGFVIMMTAAEGSLPRFIISRIVRLYPAFWACCTITFLVILAIGAPRHAASFAQYAVNMTMLGEFLKVPLVDGVYWSLTVELKFYALVALILAFGKIHKMQEFLVLWLVVSVILANFPIKQLNFILIADYSSYFIAGAAFFLVWSKGISLARIGLICASWGMSAYQSIGRKASFEVSHGVNLNSYVIVSIITVLYLVMLLVAMKRTGALGNRKWLLFGALTYPIYLLHERIGFMIFDFIHPLTSSRFVLWAVAAGIIGLSYVVHVSVEKKFSPILRNWLEGAQEQFLSYARAFPK